MQYGRKAFGHQRAMSPAARARNVAASIKDHGYSVEDATTWSRYGLETNVVQQQLVLLALAGK